MAKVTTHNDTAGTADGMTKYRFSGSPTDQYEHRGEVGETRVMRVTVECVAEGYDQVTDGIRHQTKWRVINAEVGEAIERPAGDPELPYGDEGGGPDESLGDYPADPDESEPEEDADDENGNVIGVQFSDNV